MVKEIKSTDEDGIIFDSQEKIYIGKVIEIDSNIPGRSPTRYEITRIRSVSLIAGKFLVLCDKVIKN